MPKKRKYQEFVEMAMEKQVAVGDNKDVKEMDLEKKVIPEGDEPEE